ncbi:MAG: glycosyltransferase family 39 protein, partial [Burkholderiales bacterium]|nr:glycosyltransferase family 39 protein [Burkholderiales bacterium]
MSAAARAALFALLAAVALASRTAMPVDETRYLAVAWEMWTRGDFHVPHLNGAPYSHTPPLLFWLIHAG